MIALKPCIARISDGPQDPAHWIRSLHEGGQVLACEPVEPGDMAACLDAAKRLGLAMIATSHGPGGKNPLNCWTEYWVIKVPEHAGEILDRDFDVDPYRPAQKVAS